MTELWWASWGLAGRGKPNIFSTVNDDLRSLCPSLDAAEEDVEDDEEEEVGSSDSPWESLFFFAKEFGKDSDKISPFYVCFSEDLRNSTRTYFTCSDFVTNQRTSVLLLLPNANTLRNINHICFAIFISLILCDIFAVFLL